MNRKLDHIKNALELHSTENRSFDDITFVHHSLRGGDLSHVSTKTTFLTHTIEHPFFINAMTGGGGDETFSINKRLAQVCRKFQIPMAVGSQMAGIKDKKERRTFEVVRSANENGLLFANIGAEGTLSQAKEVVSMLSADALQIHLNHIQELVMPEGDRAFTNRLHNIAEIVEKVDVPVIVKEVGFGISKETVETLESIGVQYIDVSGKGGTNFSAIENKRRDHSSMQIFDHWGISTPCSLIESITWSKRSSILASGGIKNGLDLTKSLALGAKLCGLSSTVLHILMKEGEDGVESFIQGLHEQIRFIMTALGAHSIEDLKQTDLIISGETDQWLSKRGIDTSEFSRRSSK